MSGNPDVRRAVLENKEPQIVAWAVGKTKGGGRGFGFTGASRPLELGRSELSQAGAERDLCGQPKSTCRPAVVSDKPLTLDELVVNQDEPIPTNLDKESIRKKIPALAPDDANKKPAEPAKSSGARVKPAYSSKLVSKETSGHAVEIEADIHGAKQLYLVIDDGNDGIGCDWADWCEPRLIGPAGEKKLTDLKWKMAANSFGAPQVNNRMDGQPMKVAGNAVEYGIGTHASSVIGFDLPEGYDKFKARGALDDGGTSQGCGSTVTFAVYSQDPGPAITTPLPSGTDSPKHDAANAIAGLDVAESCAATLFSSEPQISNITSIDIDQLGRVWAAEVKNYRKWKGSRPEGDRILVLEDTNGDGAADKQTIFYQGTDIDSAHGVCVLGNRVIVSALDKVQVFYDDDGDLKSDRREVLFSGISGAQHDHGIHACVFGPDGKLYFNFGNAGQQVKDKDGKPLIDAAGNEINNHRKPYQEGMVFRCNLDGSGIETLGWNFRNNWEVTVDSFGTIWQSDNDDDGNKGVRINYVMEFGNYGYKDEISGAAWNQQRTNWETEIPLRHWHLNDPGVVPNLLQTGAGSPTGITIYEGSLLPQVFRNQIIHCDAGPNICRAYAVASAGAGYKAEIVDVLHGARDNWYRPSDVSVAPDGSLFIADWYDPGVGGHNQQEVDKGRIFRVAPLGVNYQTPKFDFSTAEGAAEALKNPNYSVRYLAFTALHAMGAKADPALAKLYGDKSNPRVRARALWVWGQNPGEGPTAVNAALGDADADIRITGLRLARELKLDTTKFVRQLADDPSPAVRRECAIALRHSKASEAPELWAQLASKHDGQDRWYLEALGIGADENWDAYLGAYLTKTGNAWNTPAGRDIIWRSRAAKTPELLAKIMKDPATTKDSQPRYLRAFDFLPKSPEKEKALQDLLGLE